MMIGVAGISIGLGPLRRWLARIWPLSTQTRWLLAAALASAAVSGLVALGHQTAALMLGTATASSAVILVGSQRARSQDLAELSQRRQQEDRRAEQVAALGHELRSPLSMIKASADLLLEQTPGPLTADQRKFLRVIDQQCAQVITLCEMLLIQARIDAGLFSLRRQPVDLSALAQDVVRAMRPLAAQRNQRISLDTPQIIHSIPADPTLVVQVLTNLLANASRFTSEGGNISVRVTEIDDGVAVYVTDDGAGMTREQRRRLFRRFATGRPLEDGTGLGLVITKQIVELHGGSILVDTTAQKGTTFLFTLPQ